MDLDSAGSENPGSHAPLVENMPRRLALTLIEILVKIEEEDIYLAQTVMTMNMTK